MENHDLVRLKAEYTDRRTRLEDSDIYSPINQSYLFAVQQRQRAMSKLLRAKDFHSLSNLRVLEVGCGHGDALHEMLLYRMASDKLHGVELLPERIADARTRFPGINLSVADAQNLPYGSFLFDIVAQFTVFSSILDDSVKANIAAEMRRVVKRDGIILWYDFWLNPLNSQTKGLRKPEISRLFPDCELTFKRITLAPPLARRLVPLSWTVSALLEKLLLLNTHFLVAIKPK